VTGSSSGTPVRAAEAARARIIDAAIRCIGRKGAEGASMAAIAAEGGVSKGLLHYHYADRARLLAEVVTQLANRLIAREQAAMDAADGGGAVDALWKWLEGELARGELRALLELALLREPQVRVAAASAAARRRRAATRSVEALFGRLQLVPRVPAALLGGASVAFIDGLAADSASGTGDPRVSFDVFWLALLGLAE
jgi:AcrR family transcriptional regulator